MKKLLHFSILTLITLLLNACSWLAFMYPSYWEFRKLCKLNNLPKSQEKYDRILGYFDKKLDNNLGEYRYEIEYSSRIDLRVYIRYKNPSNKTLIFENIDKMYFRPIWKSYEPNFYGNEGSGEFELNFDGEIDCRKFVGELDG